MAEALFQKGSPVMFEHTPSGADVAAGEVVVSGDLTAIAHSKIEDGKLGNLAYGGGIYEVTVDAAITIGKKIYWDNTANKVTETSTGNKVFGFLLVASAADGDKRSALHNPAA